LTVIKSSKKPVLARWLYFFWVLGNGNSPLIWLIKKAALSRLSLKSLTEMQKFRKGKMVFKIFESL